MKKIELFISFVIIIIFIITCSSKGEQMTQANTLPDFDTFWNYNKPAETRVEFEKILLESFKQGNKSYHLQLITQLARTY